jgi:hypothetical protein
MDERGRNKKVNIDLNTGRGLPYTPEKALRKDGGVVDCTEHSSEDTVLSVNNSGVGQTVICIPAKEFGGEDKAHVLARRTL